MKWLLRVLLAPIIPIIKALKRTEGPTTMREREAQSFHTHLDGKPTGDTAPWHKDKQ